MTDHDATRGRDDLQDGVEGLAHRLEKVQAEVERLTHLLGSHADGHRCTCEELDPGQPGVEPPTWEQDPWCPTHPDMDFILTEVKRLTNRRDEAVARAERAEARYEALRAHVQTAWNLSAPDGDRSDILRDILDRDDERGAK